jgi:predicted alpha/beta-fold hydrolase
MHFNPPFYLKNPHLQTILASRFRQQVTPSRTVHAVPAYDGELIRVHHYNRGNNRLAILSHGLEGNADRSYIVGMVHAFLARRWDVLAWHNRTCSPQAPRTPKVYHSGFTADLSTLVHLYSPLYESLFLTGFSMGGNITLKLLGEAHGSVPGNLRGAAAVSVPTHLGDSSAALEKGFNRIYSQYFLDKLQHKMKRLHALFPEHIPGSMSARFDTLHAFDNAVTAKLHGFESADHYYRLASSAPFLPEIRKPVLVLNAKDDPFLTPSCFPGDNDFRNTLSRLHYPAHGGHVGFISSQKSTFAEQLVPAFAEAVLNGSVEFERFL